MVYFVAFIGGFLCCVLMGRSFGVKQAQGLPPIPLVFGLLVGNLAGIDGMQCGLCGLLGWVLYLAAAQGLKKHRQRTEQGGFLQKTAVAYTPRLLALEDVLDPKGSLLMKAGTTALIIEATESYFLICKPVRQVPADSPHVMVLRGQKVTL